MNCESWAAKGKGTKIRLAASTEAAVYLLNEKRSELVEIEERYGVIVEVVPEGEDEGAKMAASSHGPKPKDAPKFEALVEDEDDDEDDDVDTSGDDSDRDDDGRSNKKRRRRRGGRGRNKGRDQNDDQDDSDDDSDAPPYRKN